MEISVVEMEITSKDNAKIKWAAKLVSSAKYRRETGLFVLEGLRLCRDAAENGAVVRTLFYTERFVRRFPEDFARLCRCAGEDFCVGESVFQRLADTESPQGIVFVCEIPALSAEIVPGGKYLILENLSDPSNVGAVSRTAEAMGLDGMFVCGGCDCYSPKALRASMGALLRFPAVSAGDVTELLARMKQAGIATFAAVVDRADCLVSQADFSGGCAVVVGNEAGGVSDAVRQGCDRRLTIPMRGRAESLNAAVAAAILIYEMTK